MDKFPTPDFSNTEKAFAYKTYKQLKKAQFVFSIINSPTVASLGIGLMRIGLSCRLPIRGLIRTTVFDLFCGGESIQEATKKAMSLHSHHIHSILDYSAEGLQGVCNDESFDATMEEIIKTIDAACVHACIPFCVFKPSGIADINLLTKIQSKESLTEEERQAFARVKNRFEKIAQTASDLRVPVLIDAEESWAQDVVDDIVYDLMRRHNREKAIIYNTYQLYRHDILARLEKSIRQAQTEAFHLGAKLVRGAYMEKERQRAKTLGYPSPICATKQQTDESFDNGQALCLRHLDVVSLICCTHNEHSVSRLLSLLHQQGIAPDDERIWFAQLLGMSDHISFNLAPHGFRVAKYMPYAPIPALMPYLVRRAQENASVRGQSPRELKMIAAELKRRKEKKRNR